MTDSEKITYLEKELKMSTRKLAAFLELKTPQTLYDIHKGKHGISKDLGNVIVDKIEGVTLDWIFDKNINQSNTNGHNILGHSIQLPDSNKEDFIGLLQKKDEQIDRLLTIIEKLSE